jgi:hypothetical protein
MNWVFTCLAAVTVFAASPADSGYNLGSNKLGDTLLATADIKNDTSYDSKIRGRLQILHNVGKAARLILTISGLKPATKHGMVFYLTNL